jgi:GH24 family phage-related lysozyme (muramidase)
MQLTPEGWTLLKTWEGCRLSGYPDPASGGAPWTIGYGHTGPDVVPGLTITQQQADALLQTDAAVAASAVKRLLPGVALLPHQRDALISFCFNVGIGALETSTLRKRLIAGEAPAMVISQELPRWSKGPNGPVEGLKRRRAAEVAHANGAIEAKRTTPPLRQGLIQLAVPYLSQNDSATGQGIRMCFSSTCAMAAAFLKPGCIKGSGQPDDQYLALVQRHGDTTDANAQVAALRSLGINATFRTNGRIDDLLEQLGLGIPCPVGWLHKGSVASPTGGGHWSLVIGWDPDARQLLMHDPNGEADLVNGGYVSTALGSGKALRYSERNWGRRWQVEGAGSGWWIQISPAR